MSNVSIITQPHDIALIEDGLNVTLRENHFTNGDKAYLTLEFAGDYNDYSNGKNFCLKIIDRSLTFTFSDNTNNDNLLILSGQSTETAADIRDRVAEALRQTFYIQNDYEVFIGSYEMLVIIARKTGPEYDIAMESTTISVLTADETFHGSNSLIPNDFRFYLAICNMTDGKNAIPLGEDMLSAEWDESLYYQAENDIAEYMRNTLKTSFTWPFTGNTVRVVPNAVLKYYIRYGEYFNNEFKKIENTYDNPLMVLPGGLNSIDKDLLKIIGNNYYKNGYNAKRFLTWAPQTKRTFPFRAERLYFLNIIGALTIKTKLYYQNGTTDEKTFNTGVTISGNVLEIACGPAELFSENERDGLNYYELWIEKTSDNTSVSEIRTFKIDYNYYENIRTLIFRNSFEMYDILHITGKQIINDNVNRDIIETYNSGKYRKQINKAENKAEYILNSGWLSGKETRLWLQDAILSSDMFITLGDFLLPIIQTNSKILRKADKENIHSIELRFTTNYDEQRYSAIIGESATYIRDENYHVYTDENGVPYVY